MSKQPAVRAKTNTGASKQPKKKSDSKDEVKGEDSTVNDEEMARRLQEELYNEQEESDLELARRLQQEEESKHSVMFHPTPANMSRMRPMRPTSATPIHALFQNLFGMMPQAQELEDEAEETTPAMEPGAGGADRPAGTQPSPSAVTAGSRSSGTSTGTGAQSFRPRIYGNRNRSPQRQAGRSPERVRRGGVRPVVAQSSPEGATGSDTTNNDGRGVTDMLPGVAVNPERGRHTHRPYRRFMFGRRPGLTGDQAPRPLAPMGHHLLGPREDTMNLPDGELDPELMVLDTSPTENTREDDFINIMRDPFLLLLLLSSRDPNFLVPDDLDVGDYESLWDLAERLGEVRSRGMKEEDIAKLPTRNYMPGKEASDENCSICLSEYKAREKVSLLPCGHEYHKNCLIEWLKRNASCPVCRTDVKENES